MAAKKSFFGSDIFIMVSIIFFLLLAIAVLFAYNKNKIMETFLGESAVDKKYRMEYYYMDGCGHCEDFDKSGVWNKLSGEYGNKLEFKKYNMKDSKDRIEKYDISGYPTIIIIDKSNSEKKVAEYNDERKYEKMKAFVSKYAGM
jgi:hypothetical protein